MEYRDKLMNDILHAIKTRRSIRAFKSDMPARKDIEEIIEAGLYAASGNDRQATIIIAVTRKELRDRLSETIRRIDGYSEGFDPFYGAPVILIVLSDQSVISRVYDGSLVMGNMMLAAHSLGLGSLWVHRAKREFELPEYIQLLKDLGIPGKWEGIAHLAVGYIDGDLPAAPARKSGRVFWVE